MSFDIKESEMKQLLRSLAIAFCIACLPAMMAAQTTKPAKPKAKPAAAKSALPASAEKIGDNKWRYKDASGKTWLYFATPFGYSRTPESDYREPSAAAPIDAPSAVKVTGETGDTVNFEMRGPVGTQRWSKKKSELTADEKKAVEESQKRTSAPSAQE